MHMNPAEMALACWGGKDLLSISQVQRKLSAPFTPGSCDVFRLLLASPERPWENAMIARQAQDWRGRYKGSMAIFGGKWWLWKLGPMWVLWGCICR